MHSSLLSDLSLVQLLIRMAATAFVVIGVAMAVGRLGPVVGGALAGLPIVLGPGFFFLVMQAPPGFISHAAIYSLFSLCATQIFLLAYIGAADRARPLVSLLGALAAWGAATALFRLFPPQALVGIALFTVVTAVTRKLGAAFVRGTIKRARADNLGLLLLRGILAGLLVAGVTAAANQLGATASGLLLAFPIGYTVLSITIHEQFGAQAAAATLHSAIFGTISLAGFCAVLAIAILYVPEGWAFVLAVTVSLAITIALILLSRFGRNARTDRSDK
ncbi:hypothetical protein [Bordetella genomosp. 4]|uniref:hypothetical protein n=1 Tax=Bordetella genomosp. 4 TaxID=463044 RepID=UPI000B9E8D73|nr:hypothetical protein [Bordetella genomosp. 4]OZI42949.1 hypothetical protein CAL21_19220 [Bordetella genomosp. 4]